jgi:UDP-GlcNAc3NAcA epimerase
MALDIMSVVGARPQFVKVAVVARAARLPEFATAIEHRIIHTGQHYDASMSGVFFDELGIPPADYNLDVGSGPHGAQTGEMMKRLEETLMRDRPGWLVVYGDTNSTLAGAVVAAKLHIPIAHVEAGLRSFNRRMPEEINRVIADHVSTLLLCPTERAMENLRAEGLAHRSALTGDVMFDAVLAARARPRAKVNGREARSYALATVHRAENTDDETRLRAILQALERIAAEVCPVVFPAHPRTLKTMAGIGWKPRRVEISEPVSYFEMIELEQGARMILTDSGGVQKEAHFLRVPCVTLRDETEWTETLQNGCNALTGADGEKIFEAARRASEGAGPWANVYGEGHAGEATLRELLKA